MDSKVGSTQLQTLLSYDEFEPMCTWQREDGQDVLVLHLPDFKKDQLRIQISNTGLLKITGESVVVEGKRKSRFQKEVKVTKEYDSNNIHAKFSQGRLRVTLPKKVSTTMPELPPPVVNSPIRDGESNSVNSTEKLGVPSATTGGGQLLKSRVFTQIIVNVGFALVMAFSIYTAYKYWTLYVQVDED